MKPNPSHAILHERILSHTALLIEKGSRSNGSGVLVKIADKIFVLTAAHVIDQDNFTVNLGLEEQQTPFSIVHQWEEKDLDLGYIELKPFEVEMLRADFITPYRLTPPRVLDIPPRQINLEICGFPTMLTQKRGASVNYQPAFITSSLLDQSEWPPFVAERKDPEYNFVLLYGEKQIGQFRDFQGNRIGAIHPHGLSGCGIWYVDTTKSQDPTYRLIGIQHSFFATHHLVAGTYVAPLIERIIHHYGLKLEE